MSADRANAIHWSDTPTPVVIGTIMSPSGEPVTVVKLGSTSVLNLAPGGDAKFLEFHGHGLEPSKALANEYMDEMAILLSRILSENKSAERAEAAAIHRAGENAVLSDLSNSISIAFTKALNILADWVKVVGPVSYSLNNNFYPTPMSSQMLTSLTATLVAGKISNQEFFDSLIAGDVIRPDKEYDDHIKEIALLPKPEPVKPVVGTVPQDQSIGTRVPGTDNTIPQ